MRRPRRLPCKAAARNAQGSLPHAVRHDHRDAVDAAIPENVSELKVELSLSERRIQLREEDFDIDLRISAPKDESAEAGCLPPSASWLRAN